MIVLFLILIGISLYGVKVGAYNKDYMSLASTNAIKGIFAVIILFSHMRGYLSLSDTFDDRSYISVLKYIGQMMVAPYFFYSGYGLMESLKRKPNYKDTFLRKRLLRIVLHFDLAVVLYVIVQAALGTTYALSTYLLSLTGWTSVGNSNWFIFDILMLYLFFYIVLKLFNNQDSIVLGCGILCVLLWAFLSANKTGSWWVDTIMTFPLGIGYSLFQSRLDQRLRSNTIVIYILFSFLTILLIGWHLKYGVDRFGFCSSLFCLWLVVFTMKVKLDNRVLQWLGTHAFAIYIFQRLPMIVFSEFGVNQYVPLFVIITISTTLCIAQSYHKMLSIIDKRWL